MIHSLETENALSETKKDKKIPVIEIFGPTIQGEGVVAGSQTFFLRLGLCDYKCTMCDSMHAVDPKAVKLGATRMTQKEIADEILSKMGHTEWLTISGGNPCIHNLWEFCVHMKDAGKKLCVETQGTKMPEWLDLVDIITVSPKGPGMGEVFDAVAFKKFMTEYAYKMSVKIVVFSAQDLEFASAVFELVQQYVKNTMAGEASQIEDRLYLSLGNPFPPKLDSEHNLNDASPEHLIDKLLTQYDILAQEIMQDARLVKAKFLPQLHVLVWGNQKGK